MENSLDLMSIYGIPPARYSEDNPNDLFLNNLPSLEQIAAFNLANRQLTSNTATNQNNSLQNIQGLSPGNVSTPATTIGNQPTDITGILMPENQMFQSTANNTTQQGTELMQQITDFSKPFPVTAESIQYMNGFIRTQIGRRAQFQFLIGNSELVEKDGFLLGVGANYILINEIGTNDITTCDFYNIKFIRFLY